MSLYPCGGNADPAYSGQVGLYLKLLSDSEEVDATFALRLKATAANQEEEFLGNRFECGMTFCAPSEAGESTGRCEDWGAYAIRPPKPATRARWLCGVSTGALAGARASAIRPRHLYPTSGLVYELSPAGGERQVAVDVELAVWAQRAAARGAALSALGEQASRCCRGQPRHPTSLPFASPHSTSLRFALLTRLVSRCAACRGASYAWARW